MFNIPVILLKNLVILPNQEIKLELNNVISGKAINDASSNFKSEILVVAPMDLLEEEPSVDDLPKVGVIAKIKNKIDNDGVIEIKLRGLKRVAVNKYYQEKNNEVLYSEVMYIDLPALVEDEENAILKKLVDTLKKYINISKGISNDILNFVSNNKDLNKITDAITSFLPFNIGKKLEYMQEINPIKRAKALIKDMNEEIKGIEIDNELEEKIDESLQNDQRKFILKEKMKVLKQELGEDSWKKEEVIEYRSHFGMDEIKTRISEYVAIKNLNRNIQSPIICLVGPPGVGKTTIAMSIARALNRDFYKISVGGLNDSTELVGSRRTYLASAPGKIIQGLNKCGSNNPLILIDEVDKMVKDYKGDPASTLLEILDPNQNKIFTDNYIEEPFDLSGVLFILTANNVSDIPKPILDRVELIELHSYTVFEKKDIAKNYMLPNILLDNMVYDNKIKFSDELLYFLINNYTDEAGVRDLERILSSLARKITINNVKILNEERVVKLLGNPKYTSNLVMEEENGVVNTLAVSNSGGTLSKIEVVTCKGNDKLTITGNAGNILKESISVVLTMLKLKYKYSFHNEDIHVHFLDASSKKDGPSAGLALSVALCSLKENKKVPNDVAFTGEVSLNGSILKIGGLKEKLIAAYNKNIKVVYMPKSNSEDLENVPKLILDNMEVIPVSNFNEVYTKLFK